MLHRIAIWRVFITLGFSTFSTKSAETGHRDCNLRRGSTLSGHRLLGAHANNAPLMTCPPRRKSPPGTCSASSREEGSACINLLQQRRTCGEQSVGIVGTLAAFESARN